MVGRERSRSAILRAAARGLVAAMAMTGTRTVTAGIAREEMSPPEAIVRKHALGLLHQLPERHREALTELLHWTYGAGGGALFGLLPARVRRHPASGPAYGLAIWLGFELGIAPLLGVPRTQQRHVLWRVMVALDHVLYGLVVAGRLAPEPAAAETEETRNGG